MGFKSHVIFAVEESTLTLALSGIKNLALAKEVDDLLNRQRTTSAKEAGWIMFEFEWTKWSTKYADIRWITEFMSELEDEQFYFIRLGEEDMEEAGDPTFCPWDIEYVRQLNIIY